MRLATSDEHVLRCATKSYMGNILEWHCTYLLPYERMALVEALRRDAESERTKALDNPGLAAYHLENARMNVRIIEAHGFFEERRKTLLSSSPCLALVGDRLPTS